MWYDREGKVIGTVGEPGPHSGFALSPDGKRLALTKVIGADAAKIWLLDLSRGGASKRFTFGTSRDTNPVWSPDGSSIIFSSSHGGPLNLYQRAANGGKDEELMLDSSETKLPTSWSPDGRFLLYTAIHPKTKMDIWLLPLAGDSKPVPFQVTDFNERTARFSPDGKWVSYTSDETGQEEVYVRSFSMNAGGTSVEVGGKWPISNGFGVEPRWRGDGRELYYRSRGGRMMAVEIAAKPSFRAGSPQLLGGLTLTTLWDSTADGKRFLNLTAKSGPPYTVMMNWQSGLKK
jgi:Tol biopolymer transport system component